MLKYLNKVDSINRTTAIVTLALVMMFTMSSCGKDKNEDTIYDFSSEELCEKLENAFQLSSTSNLEQFFADGNKSVSSNTAQDEITKTIYDIYREFFSPSDLTVLGRNGGWDNNLNSNCKYVVIQNNIYYAVVEKSLFDTYIEDLASINDFRPQLNLTKNQVLYLLPKYEKALNCFLGTEANDDNWERYKFIRPQIPILIGHWGWYWHIATHPEVSSIYLDTDKTTAKVKYRLGYGGGEAILEKNKNNKWIITNIKETGIE